MTHHLLAARAAGFERSDTSRRAEPDAEGRHPRGRTRTRARTKKTDQNATVEALVTLRESLAFSVCAP